MSNRLGNGPIICTICARGGSKGVPGKNIRPMHGVPLIVHSIRTALETGVFDEVAVSSDSDEILQVAESFGATRIVKRPAELADDLAAKIPAIRHCVVESERQSGKKFQVCVDLDATSPLRKGDDIIGAIELLLAHPGSNVVSGCRSRHSPYFNLVEETADGNVGLSKQLASNVVRRQDAPRSFDLNGSVYAWYREVLMDATAVLEESTYLFEMPGERSLDIDSPLDWDFVEFVMGRAGK